MLLAKQAIKDAETATSPSPGVDSLISLAESARSKLDIAVSRLASNTRASGTLVAEACLRIDPGRVVLARPIKSNGEDVQGRLSLQSNFTIEVLFRPLSRVL